MKYWLMKTEPGVFSIQDLRARKREPWDGVRNYQVRNFMRDQMCEGDLALFYHSNANPSGIAGICRIVGNALPDPTQFQPNSKYFDPKADPNNPRWWLCTVEFVEEFSHIISLEALRNIPNCGTMEVLRKGQRLSIMPVTKLEFDSVIKVAHD